MLLKITRNGLKITVIYRFAKATTNWPTKYIAALTDYPLHCVSSLAPSADTKY